MKKKNEKASEKNEQYLSQLELMSILNHTP